MTLTYIHFLGVIVALAYFVISFIANQMEHNAFHISSNAEKMAVLEANPNQPELGHDVVMFLIVSLAAEFANSFSLSTLNPIAVAGVVGVAISAEIRNRSGEENQRLKEASALVPRRYTNVQRKAGVFRMSAALIWFVFLVFFF